MNSATDLLLLRGIIASLPTREDQDKVYAEIDFLRTWLKSDGNEEQHAHRLLAVGYVMLEHTTK